MIECDLLSIPEYGSKLTPLVSGKTKKGRYHGSVFPSVKFFGTKKWVVATYIELEDETLLDKMELQDVIDGCFEKLNTPPPRKSMQKKHQSQNMGIWNPTRLL